MKAMYLLLATLLAFPAWECHAEPVQIDVNVEGSVREISDALDKVAHIRRTDARSPITISVGPGTWYAPCELRVDARHARADWGRLRIAAAPGARPRVYGGKRVLKWTRTTFNGRADVWSAPLKGDEGTSLLFLDGERLEEARWPNAVPGGNPGDGWAHAGAPTPERADSRRVLTLRAEDWRGWSEPTEGRVVVIPTCNWRTFAPRVALADEKSHTLAFRSDLWYSMSEGDRWHAAGYREELDAPGEWYHDRTAGIIYLIPPRPLDPNGHQVVVPLARGAFRFENAANVELDGFEIAAAENGVTAEGCTNVAVSSCCVHDVGFINGNGISFVASFGCSVKRCRVWNVGQEGILLGGGSAETLDKAGNVAFANEVHHTGRVNRHSCGILLNGQGNRATRNWVHDVPRSGICPHGRLHLVDANRLERTNLESEDCGAIYMGGYASVGIRLLDNWIDESVGYGRKSGEWRSPYFVRGIHLDEAAGDVMVAGNVVIRSAQGAMNLHSARHVVITNNVFISNATQGGGAPQIDFHGWTDAPDGLYRRSRRAEVCRQRDELLAKNSRWAEFPSLARPPDEMFVNGHLMNHVRVVDNVFCYPDQPESPLVWSVNFATNANENVFCGNRVVDRMPDLRRLPAFSAGLPKDGDGTDCAAFAREIIPLVDGWRFFKCGGERGDAFCEPSGCHRPNFDDARWSVVRVPHDWGIAAPFDRKYGPWTGALPCFGVGWYRYRFKTTPSMAAGRVAVEFDGAMSDSDVYVNGVCVGGRPSGYVSFVCELTEGLRPEGEENVLAVRLNNRPWSSRWYPGGGLYRPVRLVVTGGTRIAYEGVWVKPRVRDGKGMVEVDVQVDGDAEDCRVRRQILGEDGMEVRNPRLWDVDAPNLYTARVELVCGNRVVDAVDVPFGFRTAEFRPQEGFFLNGRRLKINGVCLHHDLGPLGAAVDRTAVRRQLKLMREMGANALRTSHNPPAREVLEECDRLGLMVLDEAFDEWEMPKCAGGNSRFFHAWWERDLTDFIRRDRNHPSVIAWSVGNEVVEQGNPRMGRVLAARLAAVAHREDPHRPVTQGCDNTAVYTNGLEEAMDVYGANYRPGDYMQLLKLYPGKGVLGTETASMVSSRDTYFFPLPKGFSERPRPFAGGTVSGQVSSYDIFSQRPNNYHPDVEFHYQDQHPQVYGEFVWTGIDYLGEPAPVGSSRSSYYGAADLCGFPKDRYYAYRAQWRPDVPTVHVLPHWTWPGREGEVTPVWVYTSGDEAELFLNGRFMGRRKKNREKGIYTLEWNDVRYEPGELRVVAYREGLSWAEGRRMTAGSVAGLLVEAESATADDTLVYFRVALVDAQGTVVPGDDRELSFEVEGEGALAGVCNGDATDYTGLQQRHQKTFRGLCQVIVRRGRPNASFRLVVTAKDLSPESVTLPFRSSSAAAGSGARIRKVSGAVR